MTFFSLAPQSLRKIPEGVWALGFVSLLMDVSSEMIHALLPVYLVTTLGASMTEVGVIEGVAESTASIVKIFSGALSDWLGRRKLLAAIGYGLAALTKPAFPLAQNIGALVAARFVDRLGKGIRGAPRDALVADLAPAELRGAAFGLRQSLDTVGAFLGPALAILLMWRSHNDFKLVFWIAVLPAFLAVTLLLVAVTEPARAGDLRKPRFPLHVDELKRLSTAFWLVVATAAFFSLARFSEAFLILRARDAGLPIALSPLVLVAMNVVYALSAYPAGAFTDGRGRLAPLAAGLLLLVGADIALAAPHGAVTVAVGVALLGPAYGSHAGAARNPRRRRRGAGAARHRFRAFQSRRRFRDSAREPSCRRAVGWLRRRCDLPGERGLRLGGARRAGLDASSGARARGAAPSVARVP